MKTYRLKLFSPLARPASLALLTSLLLSACSDQKSSTSDMKLIGGTEYPPVSGLARLDATIAIQGNCTATKIGERKFLTAAHCVTSFAFSGGSVVGLDTTTLNPMYQPFQWPLPSGMLAITNLKNPSLIDWQPVTINQTFVHPNWGDGCANRASCSFEVPSANGPDIAVFFINELTPNIPIATVDFAPVNPGDRVTITGYGCETGVGIGVTILNRYKDNDSESRPLDDINTRLPYKTWENEFAWNAMTPGLSQDPAAASICPGDSGGPLFRTIPGLMDKGIVVGVNAYYGFHPTNNGVSVFNFHTRLSTSAVMDWFSATVPNEFP